MPKFNIGDRVKYIGDYYEPKMTGSGGTVVGNTFNENGWKPPEEFPILVDFDDDLDRTLAAPCAEEELVAFDAAPVAPADNGELNGEG